MKGENESSLFFFSTGRLAWYGDLEIAISRLYVKGDLEIATAFC